MELALMLMSIFSLICVCVLISAIVYISELRDQREIYRTRYESLKEANKRVKLTAVKSVWEQFERN